MLKWIASHTPDPTRHPVTFLRMTADDLVHSDGRSHLPDRRSHLPACAGDDRGLGHLVSQHHHMVVYSTWIHNDMTRALCGSWTCRARRGGCRRRRPSRHLLVNDYRLLYNNVSTGTNTQRVHPRLGLDLQPPVQQALWQALQQCLDEACYCPQEARQQQTWGSHFHV